MLFEFDTGLFADSVESFPGSLDSQAIFACGTYQLEEDASGQGTIHRQERRGKLYLFKAPFGKPEERQVSPESLNENPSSMNIPYHSKTLLNLMPI